MIKKILIYACFFATISHTIYCMDEPKKSKTYRGDMILPSLQKTKDPIGDIGSLHSIALDHEEINAQGDVTKKIHIKYTRTAQKVTCCGFLYFLMCK